MKMPMTVITLADFLKRTKRYPSEGNDPLNTLEPASATPLVSALVQANIGEAALPVSAEPEVPPEVTPEEVEPGEQVMVAWMMDAETSLRLALDHEGAVQNHHVTLAYIGRLGQDLDREGLVRLMGCVEQLSRSAAPMDGTLSGLGRFVASESSDGRDVMWAAVDCPGLDVMRAELVRALGEASLPYNQEHGFTPHVTLAYVKPEDDIRIERAAYDHQPVHFDRISVVVADRERMDFPMGGQLAVEAPEAELGPDGSEPSPEAVLVENSGAGERKAGAIRMAFDGSRVVPEVLLQRYGKLDADKHALKGTRLISSFPGRIRKITEREREALGHFLRDLGVEGAGKGRQVPWLISTADRARDGHTISVRGWKLDNYARNPVVLWQHDREQPPIGRSMVTIEQDGLHALAEFTPRDLNPFGGMIGDMVAEGFIHSPSVGWDTLSARRVKDPALVERYGYPLDIDEAELLEWSAVTVPADVGTGVLEKARMAGIDIRPFAFWASQRLDRGDVLATERPVLERLWRIAKGSGRLVFDGGRNRPPKEEPMPVRQPPKTQPHRGLRCPTCGGHVRAPEAQRDPNTPDPADPNPTNVTAQVGASENGVGTQPNTGTSIREPVDLTKLPPGVAAAVEALLTSLMGAPAAAAAPANPGAAAPPPPGTPPNPGDKPVDNGAGSSETVPEDVKEARKALGLL